jgi:UPF0271 protein
MASVDLNADLAEGDRLTERDLAVLDAVTSASLACGFHAGGPGVMEATAAACVRLGVAIGAHVSFRDRPGFGRRTMEVEPSQLVSDLVDQGRTLAAHSGVVGGRVTFLKPHGALYHQMGTDHAVAGAVVEAMERLGVDTLVCQPGTVVVDRARAAGIRVVGEGFPDRGYLPSGRLAPRGAPGGVVDDPDLAGRRAVSLVQRGGIDAVDGAWVAVAVATLCIHGDAPDADRTARSVRRALESAGITVEPFGGDDPSAPGGRPRGPGS